MNQCETLVLPVSASSGFQPDLCHLKEMLLASRGCVSASRGAVIPGATGKAMSLNRFSHTEPGCIALLSLSSYVVIVLLKACGVFPFLLLTVKCKCFTTAPMRNSVKAELQKKKNL